MSELSQTYEGVLGNIRKQELTIQKVSVIWERSVRGVKRFQVVGVLRSLRVVT